MFKPFFMHTAWRVARNDWLHMWRDRRAYWVLMGGIFTLIVTLMLSMSQYQTAAAQNAWANATTQAQWDTQPDRHPHRVSHFGDFVAKPLHPLAQFDHGVNSFTGQVLFLEAHRQNSANFNHALENTPLLRMGELSPAFVLQMMMPLALIFLGFSAIAGEREQGTLAQLLGNGLALRHLLLGKWLALFMPSVLLLVPLIMLGLWVCYSSADALLRLSVLSAAYLAYLVCWCSLVVLVSAYARTAYSALLALVVIWLSLCVAMPRLCAELATQTYPALSLVQADFAAEKALHALGDSHNPNDPHYEQFKAATLKRYQVSRVEDLPFNYNGLLMQEGERLTTQVYRQQHHVITAQMLQQNRLLDHIAWFNPMMALQKISRAACGTDLTQHIDFLNQAEQRRYAMIQYLNGIHTHNIQHADDKEQRASASFWQQAPRTAMRLPTLQQLISMPQSRILIGLQALCVWAMISLLALFYSARRGAKP